MVFSAGQYRTIDFVKIGVLLQVRTLWQDVQMQHGGTFCCSRLNGWTLPARLLYLHFPRHQGNTCYSGVPKDPHGHRTRVHMSSSAKPCIRKRTTDSKPPPTHAPKLIDHLSLIIPRPQLWQLVGACVILSMPDSWITLCSISLFILVAAVGYAAFFSWLAKRRARKSKAARKALAVTSSQLAQLPADHSKVTT